MAKSLSISDLIEQVKADLMRERADASPALFAISEVEVQVSFTAERNASGGIDLQVVQLGAGGATSQTHSITVRLAPLVTPEDVRAGIDQATQQKIRRVVTRGDDSEDAQGEAQASQMVRRSFSDLAGT
jgi:hypothetical protein